MNKLKIGIPFPADMIYQNYFDALNALGACPIRIDAGNDPREFDGLLLPGGCDVSPDRYDHENTACGPLDPALDDLQFAVTDRFFRIGKPIFGICRGHQLLNVYFGGTLHQHLEPNYVHNRTPGIDQDKVHMSRAVHGSWIESIYGSSFPINSAHHQAVEVSAPGMVVDQYAFDGVIEAQHHESASVFSVQWHPERMCFAHRRSDTADGSRVLAFFLEQCARLK